MADIQTTRTARPGTIAERRRGGGGTTLITIALLLAVIVGSWYLYATAGTGTDATAGAAKSDGPAADGGTSK